MNRYRLMQFRPLRLLVIATCIGFSACVGFVIRWTRWILRRRPRVTHGICPLHSLKDTVLADHSAGTLARSVVLYARQTDAYDYTTGADFDVVFSRSQRESTGKYWQCLCHILISTDIWSTSFRLAPTVAPTARHSKCGGPTGRPAGCTSDWGSRWRRRGRIITSARPKMRLSYGEAR